MRRGTVECGMRWRVVASMSDDVADDVEVESERM